MGINEINVREQRELTPEEEEHYYKNVDLSDLKRKTSDGIVIGKPGYPKASPTLGDVRALAAKVEPGSSEHADQLHAFVNRFEGLGDKITVIPDSHVGTEYPVVKYMRQAHDIANHFLNSHNREMERDRKLKNKALIAGDNLHNAQLQAAKMRQGPEVIKINDNEQRLFTNSYNPNLDGRSKTFIKETFENALPFHYAGSTPDENGNHVDHVHHFEHDGNTYRVQHRIFEPNAWGDRSASVSFDVKPKGSDKFTTDLTPSSSPFKVLNTISEITKRMQEKHGFNSLTASAAYTGGNKERRTRLYKRAMERLGGDRPVEDIGMGVLRMTNESIVKRGDQWVVMNSDKTKVLGKHDSEKKAKAQLAAIEISKKKRGMSEQVNYRGEFTQRLIDRVKEVKAGGINPALDIEDPQSRKGAAFALKQSRSADQYEIRTALKALEGGARDISNYVQTGNPQPGLMSRPDVSDRESREMLLKKLITYKGKL